MCKSWLIRIVFLFIALTVSNASLAAKYRPINEIPGSVPESEEEREIWEIGKAHQQEVRETGEAINDPVMEQHLEALASRLLGDMVQTIGMDVDVIIFKDPTVNAWVYPNGTIAVQTGLLAELKNEAQLAAILGHEISHFLNRHAYVQIKSKQTQSAIGKGLGVLATAAVAAKTGAVDTSLMKAGQVWTDLVTSGYSRKLETRADEQGLQLLVSAGFNPNQALPAFEALRIKDDDEVNISKMWSSHPDIDSRLKNLEKDIKKIKNPPDYIPPEEDYIRAYGTAMLVDAQLDMQRQRYQRAGKTLGRYLSVIGDQPLAWFMLGENYRKQQPEGPDYHSRIDAYQTALAVDSKYANAHKELAMTYRQQGENIQAIEHFNHYLSAAPDAADAAIIRWYIDDLNGSVTGETAQ